MTSFDNAQNKKNRGGAFRPKKINFAQVSNEPLWSKDLNLKTKGLYATIQSFVTIPNYTLYKNELLKHMSDGEKSFERAWKELKDKGYLIQYQFQDEKTKRFYYEYDLLDEPDIELATRIHSAQNRKKHSEKIHNPKKVGMEKPYPQKGCDGKGGVYNNTNLNNTVSMYVSMFENTLDVIDIGTLKKFIEDNKINEILDEELYKTLLIEVKNNKRVKRYDLYFIKTLKNIFNAGVRTISDYEKYLEDFKTKKEAEKKTKAAKSKTKTEAKTQAVKTRFHNINERFRDYDPNELEKLLKQSQEGKFGDTGIHSSYLRAVKDGLASLSEPMQKIIIAYANDNNLEIPN